MHDRVLGTVFRALTHHNTCIDKNMTRAILVAQCYIWVIPSPGEDIWMPSSVSPPGICLPSLFD